MLVMSETNTIIKIVGYRRADEFSLTAMSIPDLGEALAPPIELTLRPIYDALRKREKRAWTLHRNVPLYAIELPLPTLYTM